MKGAGWGRSRWIFLLLAAMGAALFLLGGLLGERDREKTDYAGYLEKRVRELCLSIDGVDEAAVFLTLDETETASGMFGESKTGGTPSVRGIAVVCTGGEYRTVRATVTDLLSAALGVSANRISVAGVSEGKR
jgi:stage III sporulation protein AG